MAKELGNKVSINLFVSVLHRAGGFYQPDVSVLHRAGGYYQPVGFSVAQSWRVLSTCLFQCCTEMEGSITLCNTRRLLDIPKNFHYIRHVSAKHVRNRAC